MEYLEANKVFFEAISTFDGRIKSIKVLDKYSKMDISSLDCILKEIKMISNLEPAKIDNHPVNSRIVFSLLLKSI
ncbi:MAG: hypothetical protein ACPGSD_14195 [Flavobacteriales bacterium]